MIIKLSEENQSIFESIKHLDAKNVEFWTARELMPLLEYTKWDNFLKVIQKAKLSLQRILPHPDEHITEIGKKYTIASGTKNKATGVMVDFKLSRRACYLIAQNGDSKKEAIALAQNYFASQTRKQEVKELKEKDIEGILARRKLTESEKKFAGIMNERGVEGRAIAEVKSAGDEALFGKPTQDVKNKLGIPRDKPLADHLPTISIKAKDLATEMTTFKIIERDYKGKDRIKNEHVSNNSAVRKMLTESGIYPERLPVEEDVKKLEKKYSQDEIQVIEDSKLLSMNILEIDLRGVQEEEEIRKIQNIIKNNQGNSKLRVYYGSELNVKILERDIQINEEVISGLRRYLVITE